VEQKGLTVFVTNCIFYLNKTKISQQTRAIKVEKISVNNLPIKVKIVKSTKKVQKLPL